MKNASPSTTVGGQKGHVQETIDGKLLELYQAHEWRMIPNCTGRYTCRNHAISRLTPRKLLQDANIECSFPPKDFLLEGRKDKVVVMALDSHNKTGLISYAKEDGIRYVHTLNTESGFRRKLNAIGIAVTDSDITQVPTKSCPL